MCKTDWLSSVFMPNSYTFTTLQKLKYSPSDLVCSARYTTSFIFIISVFPHFNGAIHGYLVREDLRGRLLAQLLHFKRPLVSSGDGLLL